MALDPNKFTRKTGEALGAAQAMARERNHTQVGAEHLLAALLSQPESVVIPSSSGWACRPRRSATGSTPSSTGCPRSTARPRRAQVSPGAYQVLEAADAERQTSATTTSRPSTSCSP